MTPTILLIDDNPITVKLVRLTFEGQGLRVIEAPDAATALREFARERPTLVVQDLCLPDMNGYDLVTRLRALPGGNDVPILVFSGMLSHEDEARVTAAGFDDFISKPIEPSRLVQIVRAHLPSDDARGDERIGRGRRLVVADDDPVQRKLVAYRMQKAGFEVVLAADGAEALEEVRRVRPHAILSDVLMPVIDGFRLCLEVRRDPLLSSIPVVLTTNSYVEPTDRELARRAGAHDLVLRTPELREVLTALRESLVAPPQSYFATVATGDLEDEHMRRMMRQLERQVALNAGANQRCALLAAEMSVLKGISEALAGHEDIDGALRHTLAACFDAGGISLGALYLTEPEGLRVLSFGFSREWSETELLDFFGERSLLDAAIATQTMRVLPESTGASGAGILARANVASALIVPIGYKGLTFGALVMLSRNGDLKTDDRLRFSQAVAGQISQAMAVAYAFREKERSERAAREQTAILHSVLESIGDGVGVVDGQGELILCNAAARGLAQLGLPVGGQTPLSASSGAIFDADMCTPMPFDRLPLVRAMRGEAIDGVELFVRAPDATDGVWLSASGRPWRDVRGVARGGVVVFRDVTQEKNTQSQLMVSDRMASVGLLAAGVAHEINNPLAAVLANLELAEYELGDREAAGDLRNPGELRELLDAGRQAADRVRQIVRDLKIFSRHEDARLGAVDTEKVLESSVRMAWNEIRHRARLVKAYGQVPPVEASESRLGQVFLNLIVNAAQAIPEGNAAGHTLSVTTSMDVSGRVIVEISDTGDGIAAENLHHLFTPFFTTKGPGVGTGLGLAICHRIVTDFGGEIRVESALGKGTTFRVLLPVAQLAVSPVFEVGPVNTEPTRRAHLLVIDDDPVVAGAIRRTLAREHDVVAVTAATDGLQLLLTDGAFDLILCDLMMPQMTGMELHAELRRRESPYADKIIFLTGGAFTPAARAFLDNVPNLRVEKPFDAQQLRTLVREQAR